MQGEFKKCRSCGQIYRSSGQPFCSACVLKLDGEFKQIKEFLYENPDASIAQVVEATNVEEKTVFYLLKEGRLEMKEASGYLTCRNCGSPIRSGTICEACAKKLSSAFESVIGKTRTAGSADKAANKGKMYTETRRK
jgi:predicted amidophosphoribosyltransferase